MNPDLSKENLGQRDPKIVAKHNKMMQRFYKPVTTKNQQTDRIKVIRDKLNSCTKDLSVICNNRDSSKYLKNTEELLQTYLGELPEFVNGIDNCSANDIEDKIKELGYIINIYKAAGYLTSVLLDLNEIGRTLTDIQFEKEKFSSTFKSG